MTSDLPALIRESHVPDETVARLHARLGDVQRRCETRGVDILVLGVGPFTRRPTLVAAHETNWLVMPWSADPLVISGRMAIPRAQRRRLATLAGVPMDLAEVLIAHEVPPEWAGIGGPARSRPLHPAEWERLRNGARVPAPATTIELGQAMAGVIERVAAGVTGAVRGFAASARVAAAAVAATLDPALIGVVGSGKHICEGDPAGFFVLASWVW